MDDSRIKLSDLVWESMPVKGVFVENYNCNEESYYIVRVLTKGESIQEFKFGNKIQIAGIELE